MDRYIGVDGHAVSCTLGVMGPSGKRLKQMVVETNGAALVEAVRSVPGRRHICLEEGTQSAWLYELLAPHAVEIVVTVPPESRGPKSDLRDAWTRANELRTGAVATRVYKAPSQLASLRNAVRAHTFAVRDVVRAKNRLKSVFLSRGVSTDSSVYQVERRTTWLRQLPPAHRRLAEWLGQEVDILEPRRCEAEAWLVREARMFPIVRTLCTAPGMGVIRTAQLVAIVGEPFRFRGSRQFWSYCGLAIVTRASGEWARQNSGWTRKRAPQTLGLNRKRNSVLKSVFKGAATTVIAQLPDSALRRGYDRSLTAGIKPNLAKLTLARKIAAIVLSMWKHEEVYDPERHPSVAAA